MLVWSLSFGVMSIPPLKLFVTWNVFFNFDQDVFRVTEEPALWLRSCFADFGLTDFGLTVVLLVVDDLLLTDDLMDEMVLKLDAVVKARCLVVCSSSMCSSSL